MPVKKDFRDEYKKIWAREKRQQELERRYENGDSKIGFCECGDYFKIPKKTLSEKCVSCRKK